MKTKNEKANNLATPGKPISQKQFASLIKEAEEGEFYTLEEFKIKFDHGERKP